jgi:hypothetical protein
VGGALGDEARHGLVVDGRDAREIEVLQVPQAPDRLAAVRFGRLVGRLINN